MKSSKYKFRWRRKLKCWRFKGKAPIIYWDVKNGSLQLFLFPPFTLDDSRDTEAGRDFSVINSTARILLFRAWRWENDESGSEGKLWYDKRCRYQMPRAFHRCSERIPAGWGVESETKAAAEALSAMTLPVAQSMKTWSHVATLKRSNLSELF